jgi:hypothetical protein
LYASSNEDGRIPAVTRRGPGFPLVSFSPAAKKDTAAIPCAGGLLRSPPYQNRFAVLILRWAALEAALQQRIKKDLPRSRISQIEPKVRSKRRKGKRRRTPNFQEKMVKAAQILGNLNENIFDFFDFAVKKFCGPRIAPGMRPSL